MIKQFVKFGLVGAFNTLLDIMVLNALMWTFGITAGIGFSIFKTISFTAAVGNSYWLNKYWTFRDRSRSEVGQISQFLLVSVVGAIINVGVASLIVNWVQPIEALIRMGAAILAMAGIEMPAGQIWANAATFLAIAVSMIWNFTVYKLVVFKENDEARMTND